MGTSTANDLKRAKRLIITVTWPPLIRVGVGKVRWIKSTRRKEIRNKLEGQKYT